MTAQAGQPDFSDGRRWADAGEHAVFCEHLARHPQTGDEIRVDKDRLERIAAVNNARFTPGALTLGHTVPHQYDQDGRVARATPEGEQPETVGYLKGFSVRWHPGLKKYALYARYYLAKDREAEARTYPRTSVEWFPDDDSLPSVSLLRRAPRLDLGQWTYAAGGRACLRYAIDGPDGDAPDPTDPADHRDANADLVNQICAALEKKYPGLATLAAPPPGAGPPGAAPPDLNAAGPGFPGGGGNAFLPGPGGAPPRRPEEGLPMADPRQPATPAAPVDVLAQLRADLDQERQQTRDLALRYARAECERIADALDAAGYQFDRGHLVGELVPLDDAGRLAAAERVRKYSRQAPVGGEPIRFAEADRPVVTTAEERDAAVRLATHSKISFDDALTRLRTAK
jgi:hypothetical protein